jgi:hypothetical protein
VSPKTWHAALQKLRPTPHVLSTSKSAETPHTDLCFFKLLGAVCSTHRSRQFKQQLHSLSCAPRRICDSLSLSIFILSRRLLSLHRRQLVSSMEVCSCGGPASLSIFVCEVASLSLSPYSCAPRRQLILEVRPRHRGRPHPPLPHHRAPR